MKFIAAAVQMVASDDKAANLREAEHWVRQAAAQGAGVVALPEVFIWRGSKKLETENAEAIPGPTSRAMSALAAELKIHLLAGSILETIPDSEKSFNTSLLFDSAGNIIASYRKIHLFDVDLANGVSLRESATRAPGETIVAAQTALCTMGLSVCYDLRFPELYRGLANQGAELIFVPAAFTAFTGEAHWRPLLQARAIENQTYIVAPAQYGRSPSSFETHGHTMIIDPWGKVIAELDDGAGVVTAEIDLEYLKKVRGELPALKHRKLGELQ
jgi:deaminated glutathione amidase